MRLIDADDAIRKMESVMDMQELYLPIHFKEMVIDKLQTIEKRNGMWRTVYLPHEYMGCRPTAYYCSECNQITTFRTFYCPNCGADMRGETDE